MRRLSKYLFWFHIILILVAVCAGYFLKPVYSLLIILFHEAYVALFHGCPLTHFEQYVHEIPKKEDFFQYAIRRIFKLKVNKLQARIVNYGILFLALTISIIRHGI